MSTRTHGTHSHASRAQAHIACASSHRARAHALRAAADSSFTRICGTRALALGRQTLVGIVLMHNLLTRTSLHKPTHIHGTVPGH
mmetsp:Transcript_8111/g.17780  ORF Transcript_8111/g.17780 Transcript_8111/m.17780 type:complete len:85 (+) Transcript_8111:597-851(+)